MQRAWSGKGGAAEGRGAIRRSARRRPGSVRAALAVGAAAVVLAGACGRAGADGSRPPAAAGASAGASAAAGSATSAPVRTRVVFVGTSLTAGLGLDPDSAFPALIQRKADSAGLAIETVNAGVSGETSAGALQRIDWVLREPAHVLVLETGANDGLRALPVPSTRRNIEAIVERIRAAQPTARVLLVQMEAPPNLGAAYTTSFRGMFPEIAREHGLTLVPFLLEGVAGVGTLNQADGLHPNEEGERLVAATVWTALRPVLDSVGRGPAAVGAAGR